GRGGGRLLVERGKAFALGGPHLLEKMVDLLEGADRCGQRVEHQGVLRLVAVTLEQRFDDQLVHGHVSTVQGGELLRKGPEVAGMDAASIDVALDLDATGGQVAEPASVAPMPADLP